MASNCLRCRTKLLYWEILDFEEGKLISRQCLSFAYGLILKVRSERLRCDFSDGKAVYVFQSREKQLPFSAISTTWKFRMTFVTHSVWSLFRRKYASNFQLNQQDGNISLAAQGIVTTFVVSNGIAIQGYLHRPNWNVAVNKRYLFLWKMNGFCPG